MISWDLERKNWALVILVFAPMVLLLLSEVFASLDILTLILPNEQPTSLGLLLDFSVAWVVIAIPLVLVVYFFVVYRGAKRPDIKLLSFIGVEILLYPVAYVVLSSRAFVPDSILWFYASAFIALLAGHLIAGRRIR